MPPKIDISCFDDVVHPSHIKMFNAINSNTNLSSKYAELLTLKDEINVQIGTIIDAFISQETPLLQKRILSVYERVCPSRLNELSKILSNITFGPIKMPHVSLIENNCTYTGTVIYCRYAENKSIMAFMCKKADGSSYIKYYNYNENDSCIQNIDSNDIPTNWYFEMTAISEAEAGPLIEFLKEDYDLGELGDKYNAIVDFYDVEAKLRTGVDYYWMKHEKERAQRSEQLLDEVRTATMLYENRTGVDVQQHEWDHVQGLLQKVLVALQMA